MIDYAARRLTFTRAIALPGEGESILPYERAFRVPVRIGDTLTEGRQPFSNDDTSRPWDAGGSRLETADCTRTPDLLAAFGRHIDCTSPH
ncbi:MULTISPECIES: hypothetical protein [unclassified Sphingomonas]|uniref:hypothetical protein n=1 Tax=unclassified Sphingomonas TaxID=196159 RepID=UPI0006F5A3A7|nr:MULTISPECIES: hypothetical protein [unclassified Sphingomonas]KQM62321.1 hypothetical protein ASE65_04800 [Sphingomonas sp. Leaf16]KQN13725.1 hypothetical protein ASE81_04870 [Sphingomonas sp. Leaf29]KQN23045.1 hypothetical protein ASE83_00540 [Sphingomonas sp. Leaf32]